MNCLTSDLNISTELSITVVPVAVLEPIHHPRTDVGQMIDIFSFPTEGSWFESSQDRLTSKLGNFPLAAIQSTKE